MEDRKIRVAITHGDTNGIGYELIFKTFADPTILELCTPIIYGSPKVAAYHRNVLGIQANFTIISKAEDAHEGRMNLLTTFDDEIKVEMGTPSDDSAAAALKALKRAAEDAGKGLYDVLITAPMNNAKVKNQEFPFTSQTAFLEKTMGEGKKALTILINEQLRVALATTNIPVKEITSSISKEMIIEKARVLFNTLKRDFLITNPRIAILALNPKCVEGTPTDKEEKEIIIPAVEELENKGIQAFGPYPADTFFGNGMFEAFDGVLAMYHDQGLTPFKTIDLGDGACYTAGMPIIRTSAICNNCFESAGKGIADECSFRHAIYLAIDAVRHRQQFDKAHESPLPKLYHEKRDESEKVRFAIPKAKSDKKPEQKGEEKKEEQTG